MSDLILDDLELELRKLPGVRAAGFDARDDLLIVQLHVVPTAASEGSLPVAATRIAARHADRPVAVEVVRWRDAPVVQPPPPAAPAAPPAPAALETSAPETSAPETSAPEAPAPSSETETGAAADATESTPSEATPAAPSPSAPAAPPAPVAAESTGRMRLLAVLSFPDTDELEVHLILEGRRTIGRAPASQGLVAALEATLAAVGDFDFTLTPTPRWARALESADDQALVTVALDEAGAGDRVLYGVASGATAIDAAARATLDALNRKLTRV